MYYFLFTVKAFATDPQLHKANVNKSAVYVSLIAWIGQEIVYWNFVKTILILTLFTILHMTQVDSEIVLSYLDEKNEVVNISWTMQRNLETNIVSNPKCEALNHKFECLFSESKEVSTIKYLLRTN